MTSRDLPWPPVTRQGSAATTTRSAITAAGTMVGLGEGLLEIGERNEPADLTGLPNTRSAPAAEVGVGGDVPNVLTAAALHGLQTRLLSAVGSDAAGRVLISLWTSRGVDPTTVAVDPTRPTGWYVNLLGPEGHSFEYHRAGSAAAADDYDVTSAHLQDAALLVLSGLTLAVMPRTSRQALRAADHARVPIAFVVNHRPALPAPADLLQRCLAKASVLLLSDDETHLVRDHRNTVMSARRDEPGPSTAAQVRATTGADEVVLTRGHLGGQAATERVCAEAGAEAVNVVDTAGAGDALAGSYLAHRIAGVPVPDALQAAVHYATSTVTRRGCATGYPRPVTPLPPVPARSLDACAPHRAWFQARRPGQSWPARMDQACE